MIDAAIMIPSRSRPERQITIENLPDRWLKKTFLDVPASQYKVYAKHNKGVKIRTRPDSLKNLGNARHHQMMSPGPNIVICIDDDVRFLIRDRKLKLHWASKEEVGKAMDIMVRWLADDNGLAQTSLSEEYANHFFEGRFKMQGRCNAVWGINRTIYRKMKARFSDMPWFMADMYMTLHFLRAGYGVKICYDYAYRLDIGQEGGISDYRTKERCQKACDKMVKVFGKYVTARPNKNPRLKLEGIPYITGRWKKAYEDFYRGV